MQLSEVLQKYAEGRDIASGSLKPFRAAIASFSSYTGRATTIADLRPDRVNPWLAAELERVGRRTARNNRASIVTLWRWCFDGELTQFPALRVRPIRAPLPPVEAYTQEEVERLLAACENLSNRFCRLPVHRRLLYRALILVSWHTGFRPNDLMLLRWSNIAENGCVRIVQHKTGRTVTRWIDKDSMVATEQLHATGRQLVFGELTCLETWRSVFKKLKEEAGIMRGSPKWIRRATGTQVAIEHGEDAAGRVLGHATPGIARKHYIDASQLVGDQLRLPRLKKYKLRLAEARKTCSLG